MPSKKKRTIKGIRNRSGLSAPDPLNLGKGIRNRSGLSTP